MRVELGNGKSREMTLDELLDIDWQEETANDEGEEINDPFHGSVVRGKKKRDKVDEDEYLSFDIPDISSIEEVNPEE